MKPTPEAIWRDVEAWLVARLPSDPAMQDAFLRIAHAALEGDPRLVATPFADLPGILAPLLQPGIERQEEYATILVEKAQALLAILNARQPAFPATLAQLSAPLDKPFADPALAALLGMGGGAPASVAQDVMAEMLALAGRPVPSKPPAPVPLPPTHSHHVYGARKSVAQPPPPASPAQYSDPLSALLSAPTPVRGAEDLMAQLLAEAGAPKEPSEKPLPEMKSTAPVARRPVDPSVAIPGQPPPAAGDPEDLLGGLLGTGIGGEDIMAALMAEAGLGGMSLGGPPRSTVPRQEPGLESEPVAPAADEDPLAEPSADDEIIALVAGDEDVPKEEMPAASEEVSLIRREAPKSLLQDQELIDAHRLLTVIIAEYVEEPSRTDLPEELRDQLQAVARSVRRLGYRTFGTLQAALEEALSVQLRSPLPAPEELLLALQDTGEVLGRIVAGEQSRHKTYYDLVARLEDCTISIEEAAEEERSRREEEWQKHAAVLRSATPGKEEKPKAELTQLQQIFLQEMGDHLESMTRNLLLVEQDPASSAIIFSLMRSAHSIKGAAGIVRYTRISALAHAMEDLMMVVRDGELRMTATMINLMLEGLDILEAQRRSVEYGEALDDDAAQAAATRFREMAAYVRTHQDEFRSRPDTADILAREQLGIEFKRKAADVQVQEVRHISVDVRQLDGLMNLAADLVINRTRLATQLDEVRGSIALLAERRRALRLLAGRMRLAPELGAPRPTAGGGNSHAIMGEIREEVGRLDLLGERMGFYAAEIDRHLSQLSALANDLHQSIMRTRMVPVSHVFNRFPRAIRDLALELGKQIELRITGAETPLDKAIVEEIADPLMHLLRNAADHGIEPAEDRIRYGKPAAGILTLSARHVGNQVIIEVSDDGAGVDLDRVRDKAVEKGLMAPTQASNASEQELFGLLLRAGFSTAKSVTTVSGRGVGLDVVNEKVMALKGTLSLESHVGEGTVFTLRLPLSLAISQALLFEVSTELFALPLNTITEVVALRGADLHGMAGSSAFNLRGEALPLHSAAGLLGLPEVAGPEKRRNILVLSDGTRRVGLVVEGLAGRAEVVVKELGPWLAASPFLSGATILGDGRVTLILDAAQMLAREARGRLADGGAPMASQDAPESLELAPAAEAPAGEDPVATEADSTTPALAAELAPEPVASPPAPAEPPMPVPPAPAADIQPMAASILCVDDSPSIRRFVTAILEGAGYRTATAADGIEALEKLEKETFDLVLTDLEMPRMHGFELISDLKSSPRLRHVPIVILSGRSGEKYSRKGMELGALAFIVKPFEEHELLATVRRYLGGGDVP